MNDYTALGQFISQVGAPVGIAVFLLLRQEKRMEELRDLIRSKDGILDKMDEVLDKINECCKGGKK